MPRRSTKLKGWAMPLVRARPSLISRANPRRISGGVPKQSIKSALIKTPHLNANEKYTAPTISTYETTLFHLSPSPNIT